jgi:hypothetical protein
MPDPNWLLSTAAQSAAAIVGLMGAFLLHRLLSLGAERASLERRLADVESEAEQKQAELSNLEDRILQLDAEDFIRDHAGEIVDSRGEVELRELVASDVSTSRTAGELVPEFRRVTGIVKRAFNVLENKIAGYGFELPPALPEFAAEAGLTLPKGEELQWYDAAYRKLQDEYRSVARPGRRRKAKLTFLDLDGEPTDRRPALVQAKEMAGTALLALLGEKERTSKVLQSMERAPGVRAAVLVLIYFTITGVALPLVLMPLEPDAFQTTATWTVGGMNLTGDRLRGLILAAFLSGLVFLLMYLLWAVRLGGPRKRRDLMTPPPDPRSFSKEVQ